MQTYLLKETLVPCSLQEICGGAHRYVAVLTPAEWQRERQLFDMGIELEPDPTDIRSTKAEVNYDSLTGTFHIPDRDDFNRPDYGFAFALDEKGVVFIDAGDTVMAMLAALGGTKRWRVPCLERFLYDFLELIVSGDLPIMERFESTLNRIEDELLAEGTSGDLHTVNEIRSIVRRLLVHYEQLIDITQEFEENENGFFEELQLRYLHLFMNRMARLHDIAAALREHVTQVHELYQEQLEVRQNHTMALLTVVTTVFMPLTLIAGWYGMNFRYMPELESPWGYPAVIAVSLLIAVGCLIIFRKRKWL